MATQHNTIQDLFSKRKLHSCGIRTHTSHNLSVMLYQLSYWGSSAGWVQNHLCSKHFNLINKWIRIKEKAKIIKPPKTPNSIISDVHKYTQKEREIKKERQSSTTQHNRTQYKIWDNFYSGGTGTHASCILSVISTNWATGGSSTGWVRTHLHVHICTYMYMYIYIYT